jgi:signal transduction histidine kinase
MAQMMGVAPGELLGRPLTDFYLGGPSWVDGRSEARFRRADGSEFWASLAVNRIATEVASGALAMVTDITEQRRLQEQLMVADRMASVGTLAAGVAHEINNPLAVVLANLDLAASELAKAQPDLAQVSDGLRDALEAGARVQGVVRDLKVFSRAGDDEVSQQVDVHRVVESSLRLASTEIRHRATLVRDLQPVPMVEGNEGRLGQVLLNLLVNAAQAIGEGKPDRNEIRVATRLDDKGRVEISIADTGPGMTLAVQRQLFMPFFTTKPRGIGTGLGLSICSRLVKAMGGEIACESEVGKGTCFRVALEMARGAAAAVGAPPAQIPAATRRGKVLAIDDEPMLLRIIRRSLEPMHEVVTVGSAVEALARLEKGERYDVILCDLMMPQMTGVELHAALLRLDPSIARQMVFLTGGVFTAEMRTFLDDAPNARVEKPFNMTMLKSLVAGRLG